MDYSTRNSSKRVGLSLLTATLFFLFVLKAYAHNYFSVDPVTTLTGASSNSGGKLFPAGDQMFVYLSGVVPRLYVMNKGQPGLRKVRNLNAPYAGYGNEGFNFTVYKDKLYFNMRTTGYQLWRSDGTNAGTGLFLSAPGNAWLTPRNFVVHNDNLYFTGHLGIWRTDGTQANTQLIFPSGSRPILLRSFGGKLYFARNNTIGENGLWVIEGNDDSIRQVRNLDYVGDEIPFQNKLFFVARIDARSRPHLWKTDGTEDGTVEIAGDGYIDLLGVVDERLLFMVSQANGSKRLWSTDGTTEGTGLIAYLGTRNYSPGVLGIVDNVMFMRIHHYERGFSELWRTDGSSQGTYLVKDIWPGSYKGSQPYALNDSVDEDVLFFTAEDEEHGRGLWQTDGTSSRTSLVADLVATEVDESRYMAFYSESAMAVFDDVRYFLSHDIGTRITTLSRVDRKKHHHLESLQLLLDDDEEEVE